MACETKEQTISGALYVTTQWPATQQLTMKLKLASTFGDPLFEIVKAVSSKEEDEDIKQEQQLKAFKSAINSLFSSKSPEEITNLLKEILLCNQATKREGERITEQTFDTIYNEAGLKEMYMACLFVVRANYADFFKGQKAEEILAVVKGNL